MHEPETCARRAGEHHVRADRWLAFARRARSTWAFAARAIPTEDPQRVTEASDEGCRDDDLCARCLPCRRSRDKIAKEVHIRSGQALPLHYLAADRAGHVVVIEFLDGELRARTGGDLPVPVLTNSTYADSLTHLGRHKGFGGEVGLPVAPVPGITSLARFVVAASGRAESTDSDPIGRAFDTLARARQSSSTPGGIGRAGASCTSSVLFALISARKDGQRSGASILPASTSPAPGSPACSTSTLRSKATSPRGSRRTRQQRTTTSSCAAFARRRFSPVCR